MAHLIIVRGLPGSGKSTYASDLAERNEFNHYEADMFFEDENGNYNFQANKIRFAHQWCQGKVFSSLSSGKDTVVSNTFCQMWEMKPYMDFCKINGHTFSFVTCESEYGSIHDVPEETYEKMKQRWQDVTVA